MLKYLWDRTKEKFKDDYMVLDDEFKNDRCYFDFITSNHHYMIVIKQNLIQLHDFKDPYIELAVTDIDKQIDYLFENLMGPPNNAV